MNIFRAEIANFISYGDISTDFPDGSWSRNLIKFKLDNYECTLGVYPDILRVPIGELNNLKGSLIQSGFLEIAGIQSAEIGEQIATDISWMLSFITMSNVAWYSYSYGGTGKGISLSAFYNHYRPVLQFNATGVVKDFMEKCWEKYQLLKESRKLSAIIHYLVECDRPNQLMEVQFLFASLVLESLKSTYAHSNSYEYDGSGFLKKEHQGLQCSDKSLCSKNYLTFSQILNPMFKEAKMKVKLSEIIPLRNEVFHNGLSSKGYDHLTKVYDYTQDVIREYILRLLDYKGDFKVYSAAGRVLNNLK